MKVTYIDSGILIAAFRGPEDISRCARELLDDDNREFASSDFVKLELLPKAVYNKKETELSFYEAFFESVKHWADLDGALVRKAIDEAEHAGLNAMDALHVAAAVAVGSSELVTTERPEKPIHRVNSIKIQSIFDPA